MQDSLVIKIGGSTLGQHDTTLEDLVALQQANKQVVVVHGGGKTISDWLVQLGAETRFVGGLRVTDAKSLEVVVAVLAGLINKELVAAINQAGGKAVGLTGADGGLLQAVIKNPELGYVGEITKVNTEPVVTLLRQGYIPVIAPLALRSPVNSDDQQKLLNINADTVAGEIAVALKVNRLVFLTDVPGIKDGAGSIITNLSAEEAKSLTTNGVIHSGMIPKIETCLRAAASGVKASIGDGRQPRALMDLVEGKGGTTVH